MTEKGTTWAALVTACLALGFSVTAVVQSVRADRRLESELGGCARGFARDRETGECVQRVVDVYLDCDDMREVSAPGAPAHVLVMTVWPPGAEEASVEVDVAAAFRGQWEEYCSNLGTPEDDCGE